MVCVVYTLDLASWLYSSTAAMVTVVIVTGPTTATCTNLPHSYRCLGNLLPDPL